LDLYALGNFDCGAVWNCFAHSVRNQFGAALGYHLAGGVGVRNALLFADGAASCVANVLDSLFANHTAGLVAYRFLAAFCYHSAGGVGANLATWLADDAASCVVDGFLTAL